VVSEPALLVTIAFAISCSAQVGSNLLLAAEVDWELLDMLGEERARAPRQHKQGTAPYPGMMRAKIVQGKSKTDLNLALAVQRW
jgi:hypothetical protein